MNNNNALKISKTLKELGITPATKGYYYLRTSIELALEDPDLVHSMMKGLYVKVSNQYNTTINAVERAMRYAIERGWPRGNTCTQYDLFGRSSVDRYCLDGIPSNSEFIATVADYLYLHNAEDQK